MKSIGNAFGLAWFLCQACMLTTAQTGAANSIQPTAPTIQIHGLVVDQANNLPLSYVSVGVQGKPIGCVSDSLGKYTLVVNRENKGDSLCISRVGYFSRMMAIPNQADGQ